MPRRRAPAGRAALERRQRAEGALRCQARLRLVHHVALGLVEAHRRARRGGQADRLEHERDGEVEDGRLVSPRHARRLRDRRDGAVRQQLPARRREGVVLQVVRFLQFY